MPSAPRENAITSLCAAFVWTNTAPSMEVSMVVPLPLSGRGSRTVDARLRYTIAQIVWIDTDSETFKPFDALPVIVPSWRTPPSLLKTMSVARLTCCRFVTLWP